jgi:hypothetical protein
VATREVQLFLTRYIRDPAFATGWNGEDRDRLTEELGLSEEDMALIGGLDLADLDRAAVGMRGDRLDKRRGEFLHFLKWLEVYGPVEEFLNGFHSEHCTGSEAQSLELDRFVDYAIRFVAREQLPDFLAELARFCYEYCKVAISDRPDDPSVVAGLDPATVPLTRTIRFAQPNRIVQFSYDCLEIANTAPHQGIPPRRLTRLLICKARDTFKRSQIWRLDDLPQTFHPLASGPRTLAEVAAPVGASQLFAFLDFVRQLLAAGILEIEAGGNRVSSAARK